MPQVSFLSDIKPLFRPIDILHLRPFGVALDEYTYMSDPGNASKVLATLSPHDAEPTFSDSFIHDMTAEIGASVTRAHAGSSGE